MKRTLLAVSVCLALGACETENGPPPPSPPPEAPPAPPPAFRAKDFAWSAERGTSSIRGQVAFMQSGERFSCSGQAVILTPDTPYSRNRIASLYGSTVKAALPVNEVRSRQERRPSADYSAFVRKGVCDTQNRFAFQGLPAGGWFIIVLAQPTGSGGESMALMRRVDTHAGAVRAVTLD
jgi:hypothetical protein